ncbi:Maf family protein [Thiorhodospira sibirica]|uniref:Maf family protein n=1 Tax=Thiorhodospira sibirica TaxID=154347 RepID=UPI00022C3FF2|nr:Maf family protein [Thiorhodospira sibirica]
MSRLILASASPRRQQLLAQIGVRCQMYPVDLDETPLAHETPAALATRLALAKASEAQRRLHTTEVVLGADTVVAIDGEALGKPAQQAEAIAMLTRLSGREHQVFSAVAVRYEKHEAVCLVTTQVHFKSLTLQEITDYWASGEPIDKAGAYAIQGLGALFVKSLTGSYSAVVGLPLFETGQLLNSFGIPVGKGYASQ